MTKILINDNLALEPIRLEDAEEIFDRVQQNRAYLSEWLGWVKNMQKIPDTQNFIHRSIHEAENKTDRVFVIRLEIAENTHNIKIAGLIGLHEISQANRSANMGYWLSASAQGKGIMSAACKALIHYGFQTLDLNRLVIKCATRNLKSQTVAEKLNFTKEGTLRKAEWVNDRFVDHFVYSLLKSDFGKAVCNTPLQRNS